MSSRTYRQKARIARREKYKGNPLVPLNHECLKAAIDADGRSYGVIAKALRRRRCVSSKQALNHLAHRGRRCRASLLRALAEELSVGDDWLSGRQTIPVLTPVAGGDLSQWVFYPPLPVAKSEVSAPGGPADRLRMSRAPSALLALLRFEERCDAAIRRDLLPSEGETEAVQRRYAVSDLVNPIFWRGALLSDSVGESPDDPLWVNEALPLATKFFESILEPWFEGTQTLDLEHLRALSPLQYNPRAGSRLQRGKPKRKRLRSGR